MAVCITYCDCTLWAHVYYIHDMIIFYGVCIVVVVVVSIYLLSSICEIICKLACHNILNTKIDPYWELMIMWPDDSMNVLPLFLEGMNI